MSISTNKTQESSDTGEYKILTGKWFYIDNEWIFTPYVMEVSNVEKNYN